MAPSSSIDLRPKRDADDDRVGDTDVVKTCLKRRKEGFLSDICLLFHVRLIYVYLMNFSLFTPFSRVFLLN